MKMLSAIDVLDIVLKDKDSCTILDINRWKKEYYKEHPDTFVSVTGDDLYSIPQCYYYFEWDKRIFYKQYSLKCPICGDEHFKYPLNDKYPKLEKYYKIQKLHEKSKITKG